MAGLAVAVKHTSDGLHVLTQLCTGRLKILCIADSSLDTDGDTVGSVLCEQLPIEEFDLEHPEGHIGEILFPEIAHADLVDAAAVAGDDI